ncbi:MAG: tungstate transporter permease, partial [Clostridia bacterium]|nr:tungstate transporter permease [Clostridia bacterium]
MDLVWEGIKEAFYLLGGSDPEVGQITLLTLRICGTATLIAVLIGIPLGAWLGLHRFPGRQALLSLVYMGMGLPPVVAGLWVSIFLWRKRPMGPVRQQYNPPAQKIA